MHARAPPFRATRERIAPRQAVAYVVIDHLSAILENFDLFSGTLPAPDPAIQGIDRRVCRKPFQRCGVRHCIRNGLGIQKLMIDT